MTRYVVRSEVYRNHTYYRVWLVVKGQPDSKASRRCASKVAAEFEALRLQVRR